MVKKKSFSIGSSLSQALTDTVSAAKNFSGELHIEIIPLRKIALDPDNPRDLALTFSDLHEGLSLSDKQYERKNHEKTKLSSIANSIKEQGIINPILVYKHDEQYRLIAGERRTFASILAGKDNIPAKILPEKPTELNLSLLQWIENIEREDLSLWERIRNLEKITAAYSPQTVTPVKPITATDLSHLLGCSLPQAANYKSIMEASSKLKSLLKENKIKNIEKAAFIAKAPPNTQDTLIRACLAGEPLKSMKQILSNTATCKVQKDTHDKRGRKAMKVNFGSTQKPIVAKIIIESILENKNFSHLNESIDNVKWDDFQSVARAFKRLIDKLEEEIK